MRITAVLTVRNEAAFLLDWLAWHRASGVTDFVIASNDCQDGTDDLLDALARDHPITHIRNDPPYGKSGIQFKALQRAAKADAVKNADWLLPIDIDEFVNVHTGDRTLPALIAALPEATAITLTWRVFGNAGVVRYEDTPPPLQFTRAAPTILPWPWRAAMFKTLYRNDGTYDRLGIHRPRAPRADKLDQARWYDGEGRALDPLFATKRIFSTYGRCNYALAQLNHYPLGAMESYVLKSHRGRAVHSDDQLGMDYWVERNFNTDHDASATDLWPRAQTLRDQMASDPKVANLHKTAVAWRKSTFEALLEEDQYRALFGRLLMTPGSKPVPVSAARYMSQFAQKARAKTP